MARPRRIDMELVTLAQLVVAEAKDVETLRSAQAVLLPALLDASLGQTALALGMARASVTRLQALFRQRCAEPDATRPAWGGRRHAWMTRQEESDFLARWEHDSDAGSVLVASPLRAALAQRLGRPVAASVVYRMLARHGWRKVAPDTRHPNRDPQAQEDWKKNSQKLWQRFSSPKMFGVGRYA